MKVICWMDWGVIKSYKFENEEDVKKVITTVNSILSDAGLPEFSYAEYAPVINQRLFFNHVDINSEDWDCLQHIQVVTVED